MQYHAIVYDKKFEFFRKFSENNFGYRSMYIVNIYNDPLPPEVHRFCAEFFGVFWIYAIFHSIIRCEPIRSFRK